LDFLSAIGNYYHQSSLLIITPAATTIIIFILLLLFVISFLLSGAEVALFSLSLKDINLLKTRPQQVYKRIVNLLEHPKILWASLLIGNTLVNIGIILIFNSLITDWIQSLELHFIFTLLIKVIIISSVLILFCEILPKVWATNHKIWFATTASLVVEIFNSVFKSMGKWFVALGDGVENVFKKSDSSAEDAQLEYEIDLLPDHETSIREKQILKGIRKFGNTTVKQTMLTRLDVNGIEVSSTFQELKVKIRGIHYSRLPVYKNNLDEIVGLLHTKDLLPHLHQEEFDWHSLLRTIFYVHEQKLIEDLLQDFRNKRMHMAVVVDEFGGTSGIITLEDIMEEIVGDIQDEFDDERSINKKLDDYTYLFEGKTMINDLCQILHISTSTFDSRRGESDSLAGLILEIAGKFPAIGEQVITDGFIFTPLEINKNRIEKVKLTLQPKEEI
jgi:gliding motility-associated protein GldE